MSSASQMATSPTVPGPPAPPPLPDEVPTPPGLRDPAWNLAETCLEHTARAIAESGAATSTEIARGVSIAREAHANDTPADLIDIIPRIQGHDEQHLGAVILELSEKVARTISPYPPLIPFAGKLIAPSAFYESFDRIHRSARILLAPVIFAEDTDAIGTASINPIAASILAREISGAVLKRFGIGPFLTIARIDYESWTFLSRKHFEL